MKYNLLKLFLLPILLSAIFLFQNCGEGFNLSRAPKVEPNQENNQSSLTPGRTLVSDPSRLFVKHLAAA